MSASARWSGCRWTWRRSSGSPSGGPIQEPTRLTSWEAFQQIFGDYTENAYLAYAVFGFFNNGGRECFVTRVAHIDDPDPEKNAARASTVLRDLYARGTIQVEALNEGTWGNRLRVAVGIPKRVHRSVCTHDIPAGATSARVEVARGFEPGALVRLTDGRQEAFVRVVEVGEKEIRWEQPHRDGARPGQDHGGVRRVQADHHRREGFRDLRQPLHGPGAQPLLRQGRQRREPVRAGHRPALADRGAL
ncbi:MAG: hypothetical protein KatS3mg102_2079 [Planctomycetota bacterium]|nr:MAG: hypothetical protein KatS3mg102_2079 [Planctomycetota bacterium]